MSRNAKKNNNYVPESNVTEEEKKGLFECSTSDSGFISAGNIVYTDEITSEEFKSERKSPTVDSGIIDVNLKTPEITSDTSMKLDSGIDLALSQNLSNLHLDYKDINNLNSGSCQPSSSAVQESKISNIPAKQPWELYYEQDENGDT